jgi:hypothetical protein
MILNDTKKLLKVAPSFLCEFCDYSTSKKSSFDKHLSTDKHKKATNDTKMILNDTKKSPKVAKSCQNEIKCICGKIYKYKCNYYRHKKDCTYSEPTLETQHNISNDLILELIKQNHDLSSQNSELTNKIMDICKNGTTTNNNSHNNSHNKTFNLQLFLNETCKDAMNIMDFVESIKLQLTDLENVGEVGFVDGISNIIVKNLNELDITKRPVHCTDKKREVLYVKDEDKWEKEENVKYEKVRRCIKKIADKNMRLITKYKEAHPDCNQSISKYSDKYNKIVVEALGGSGNEDYDNETKIIKKLSKEILIDKDT